MRKVFLLVALATACGPSVARDPGGGGDGGNGGSCSDGASRCTDNALEVCVGGAFTVLEQCPSACDPQLGCVACVPHTGTCNGATSIACKRDGSGFEEVYCDPVQGMSCNAGTGVCDGACAPHRLGESYIGCEYYPTVTAQYVNPSFLFAVVVANTSSLPATVTISDGALPSPRMFEVGPNSVRVETLPWHTGLKICNTGSGCSFNTVLAAKGAYHLRSTQPVTVYQFSPLDYTNGQGGFTYTNDASLLLPTNAMTGNYVVAAWPHWPAFNFPGLLAVTATADGTEVTIVPRAASGGSPSFPANTPTTVNLDRGDVLQLVNMSGDLTGSMVTASKPVQVIGGHYCSYVPQNVAACDHLEESMFPIETLSRSYIVTMPAVPPLPNGKEQVIRIVATQPDTQVSYDPPIAGAATTLAAPGDFIELSRHSGDFVVTASHKILVAQYMVGQDAGGNTGDPAMALAVATDQYRTSYLFHAPTNYEVNYVNVTAPLGAAVFIDGDPVTGLTPIGSSGYGVARVQLSSGLASDGNHSATGNEPFGISVYGYGQYTSYWYPGGLDLAQIPVD